MCYSPKNADKNQGLDPVEVHIQVEILRLREENVTLKNWVRDGNDTPRCCVCGKPIPNISIQRMLRTFLWDSRECFTKKPKKIMALEQAYGVDIVEVLKITTRRYQNIHAQCEALQISIPYLYNIIKKYCGQDYIAFFADNGTGKRRETYLK